MFLVKMSTLLAANIYKYTTLGLARVAGALVANTSWRAEALCE